MDKDKLIKRKQRAQKDGNTRQLANIINELADLYFDTGKMEEALAEYTELMLVCEKLQDLKNLAVAHRMIGEIHTNLGNYDEALSHLQQYLDGAKQTGDLPEQQRAYATLGRTYFCQAEALDESTKRDETLIAAKKVFVKSLRICEKLESTDIQTIEIMIMRARLLLNLGLTLDAQKQSVQAVELIERAVGLCVKHQLHRDLYRIYMNLGPIYERDKKYDEALKCYNLAATITNNNDDELNIPNALISEADLLAKLGRWSESRRILVNLYVNYNFPSVSETITKSLKMVAFIDNSEDQLDVEENNVERMKIYENMGDAAASISCYDKAIEYYRGMLACAEKESNNYRPKIGAALVSLAQTLKDAKRYDEALIFARRELEFCDNDDRERCRSALFLADLMTSVKDSSDSEIRDIYHLALSSAEKCDNIQLQRTVLREMYEYFLEISDSTKANEMKEKIAALGKIMIIDDETSNDSTESVGIDIDLESLSDVENELQRKNDKAKNSKSRRPAKSGLVVKRNQKGETKLHVACINNNIEEVETLLAAGHPVNVRDNLGWTPLHESANFGHIEIAEKLIKAGANINDPGGPECGNITPLHDAATCGHCSMVNLLLEYGADARVKTKSGQTVLKCLEDWRCRIEKERQEGTIAWTDVDENIYKNTRKKLRMILPNEGEQQSTTVNLHRAPLIDAEDNFSQETVVSVEKSPIKERISAGEDYKRTIERLKNRGRVLSSSTKTQQKSIKNSVAPLVNNEEQLIDDWLEEDMEILNISNSSKSKSDDITPTNVKRKTLRSTSSITPESERITKRPRRSTDSDGHSAVARRDDIDTNSSDSSSSVRSNLRQTSLLQLSGFTRNVAPRTPSPVISYADDFRPQQKTPLHFDVQTVQFKVTIGDRIINIKLKFSDNSEHLMRCLMDEIVEKFRQDTGCKLNTTFTTINGEVLQPENILHLIYTNNHDCLQLSSSIVDLEIPKITERYQILCAALNTDDTNQDQMILQSLQDCEHSEIFRLKDTEEIFNMIPLLKSLEYERNLKILNLSGSSLYNQGQLVNRTLKQLMQLQELCMQGCDIDENFLKQINNLPLQLRVLNLSYNPLGVNSQIKLIELLMPLRHLQQLNLRCCQLRKIPSSSLTVSSSLEYLDLSWNKIDNDDIHQFLQRQLTNMNLSNTGQRSFGIIEPRPFAFITIETLELSGCNISDLDVMNLLQNCQNLSKIVISDNPKLSQTVIELLLERKPTLMLINAVGCDKITKVPRSNLSIDDPSVCTLMTSMVTDVCDYWEKLWQGHAVQYKMPFDIVVFKPIV